MKPPASTKKLTRRRFLQSSAAAGTVTFLPSVSGETKVTPPEPKAKPFSFFVVADCHYFGDLTNPVKLDPRSKEITTRFINILNDLPGTKLPEQMGGGEVPVPLGVIHAGDLIESGDKAGNPKYKQLMPVEWAGYEAGFGLDGSDGQLKFPVFEVHGNHDSPGATGVAIEGIMARNRKRLEAKSVVNISGNGLHCSWDWNGVHFINAGIVVGSTESRDRSRRYNPTDSLAFVTNDLAKEVGDSGRPVIITHHLDMARYIKWHQDKETKKDLQGLSYEWNPLDVADYFSAIKNYNIIADFHGHTHSSRDHWWSGKTIDRKAGDIRVFNVDNAGHFHGGVQGFFQVEIDPGSSGMTIRESVTRWLEDREVDKDLAGGLRLGRNGARRRK